MKNTSQKTIILCFFGLLLSFSSYSQFYSYTKFTTKDGLKNYQTSKFYQDKNGLLYLGATNGIYRYDGKNWKFISLNKGGNNWSFKKDEIIETPKGLLIGSKEEKVYFLKNFTAITIDEFPNKRLERQLKFLACDSTSTFQKVICDTVEMTETANVIVDKDLNLLAVKLDTFFVKNRNIIKTIHLKINPKLISKSKCILDNKKNAYVICEMVDNSAILFKYQNNELKMLLKILDFKISINKFFIDRSNFLWISNGSNKEILKIQNGKIVQKYILPIIKTPYKNSEFFMSKNGVVWLSNPFQISKIDTSLTIFKNTDQASGTYNEEKGIIFELSDGNMLFNFKMFDGIKFIDLVSTDFYLANPNLSVKDIFEDIEGNIWYSTNSGVFKFTKSNYFKQNKNYNPSINSVPQIYDDYSARRIYFILDSIIIGSSFQNETLNSFSLKKYFPCLNFKSIDVETNYRRSFFRNEKNEIYLFIDAKSSKDCRKELIVKIFPDNSYKIFDLTETHKRLIEKINLKNQYWWYLNKPQNFLFNNQGDLCYFFNKNLITIKDNIEINYSKDLGLFNKKIIDLNTTYHNSSNAYAYPFNANKYVIFNDTLYTIENNKLIKKCATPKTESILQDPYDNSIVFFDSNNASISFFKDNGLRTYKLENKYKKVDLVDSLVFKIKDGFFFKLNNVIYKTKLLNSAVFFEKIQNDELSALITQIKSEYYNYAYSKNRVIIYTGFRLFSIQPDSLFAEKLNSLSVKTFENGSAWFNLSTSNSMIFSDPEWEPYVYYYDMNEQYINKIKPEIYIFDFTVISKGILHEWTIGTNYKRDDIKYIGGDSKLVVGIQAICLTNNEKVRYQYRLLGYEDNYGDLNDKENYIKYNNLAPDTYTLQIKACNNDGIWNDKPVEIMFEVLAPWYRTWYAYGCYALAGFMSIRGYTRSRTKKLEKEKKKLEHTVELRTSEIIEQKKIVEEKNHEITDSINYAKRIQQSMLPPLEEIYSNLPGAFVLFRPKDIVSGDFYWYHVSSEVGVQSSEKKANTELLTNNSQIVLIAAADCTGHGVPGAIMSMLATEKLNEAVALSSDVSEILSLVSKGIKKSLRQSSSEHSTRDGMDIALCSFNKKTNEFYYSGANRPLWIIRAGTNVIEEIKATKSAIGGTTEDDQIFIKHNVDLQKGDTIYIFSDGYADQFSPEDKKLMTKKFKELVMGMQHLSMPEQKNYLDEFMTKWKGNMEQTDDILVVGVKV